MSENQTQALALLKEAKEALANRDYEKSNCQVLEGQVKAIQKALTAEKKAMEDKISQQIHTEREAINDQFKNNLDSLEERLEKAVSRKSKAKSQAQKARIKSETAALVRENDTIRLQNKKAFQASNIPTLFNRPLFYRLFVPSGIKDYLLFAAVFLIFAIVVPTLIYLIIPNHHVWLLIVLWVVFIGLFVLAYIGVNGISKKTHPDVIVNARRNYDIILTNQNKINAIVKSVESDPKEDNYNLDEYTAAVNQAQTDYDEAKAQRQQALDEFDTHRRPVIEEDIRNQHQDAINQYELDYNQANTRFLATKKRYDELADRIASDYTSVIGKRYMRNESIDNLVKIISSGQADSIQSAITVYKKMP